MMDKTTTRRVSGQPRFMTLNGRRLFTLSFEPAGRCRGSVLYLPPFAEEMNRCRSHVAGLARTLAAGGLRTMLLDPWGTGESDGGMEDASWDQWVDDAAAAACTLAAQDEQPLTLWGVRTGALMAVDVARALASGSGWRPGTPPPRLLLCQPVTDGKQFLGQYLRLRIASQMVNAADRETTEQIRARLSAGEILEVAGYPLNGRLADGLCSSRIDPAGLPGGMRIGWLEVVAKPEQPMSAGSGRVLDGLRAADHEVRSRVVSCPMVWQLHKRADAPEFVTAIQALLQAQETGATSDGASGVADAALADSDGGR